MYTSFVMYIVNYFSIARKMPIKEYNLAKILEELSLTQDEASVAMLLMFFIVCVAFSHTLHVYFL